MPRLRKRSPPTSGLKSIFPLVVKKDGRRIDYAAEASFAHRLHWHCAKRPVSIELVDAAGERIEERLLNLGAREVPSSQGWAKW